MTTCFVHLKPKLSHLDNVLPFVMELVGAGLVDRPVFVAASEESHLTIMNNPVLSDAIKSLGGSIVHLSSQRNRYLRQFGHLYCLRGYLFGRCHRIETALRIGILVRFLVLFNRVIWRGTTIHFMALSVPARIYERLVDYADAMFDRRQRALNVFRPIGLVVTSAPLSTERFGSTRIVGTYDQFSIGNPRALPAWRSYLDENAEKYIPPNTPRPYFFFVLSTLDLANPRRGDALDDNHVRHCLQVLKDYNDRIHTVFKAHAVTDMKRFGEMIADVGYENYSISQAHPMMLARHAKFTFAYYSSTVLIDAHSLGCPSIDYVCYDRRGKEFARGESLLLDYASFFSDGDEAALRSALDTLTDDAYQSPERAARSPDFPDVKSPEIAARFAFLAR